MQRRRWTNLPMSEPTNIKSGEKRMPDDIRQTNICGRPPWSGSCFFGLGCFFCWGCGWGLDGSSVPTMLPELREPIELPELMEPIMLPELRDPIELPEPSEPMTGDVFDVCCWAGFG